MNATSLEEKLDLHFNRLFLDGNGEKKHFKVETVDNPVVEKEFMVTQDADAFIASCTKTIPIKENQRCTLHFSPSFDQALKRLQYGTIIHRNKKMNLKDLPHTLLISAIGDGFVNSYITFPKMYRKKNHKKPVLSEIDQEHFVDNLFLLSIRKVCTPVICNRLSKSYNHCVSKGITNHPSEFLSGGDIIKAIGEMRGMITRDKNLKKYSGFFFTTSAFGFKQSFHGDTDRILGSTIDWNKLREQPVYVDVATNIYDPNGPSTLFLNKSRMDQIAELYGINREDRKRFFPQGLSGFGGMSVEPKIFEISKPKKLIVYNDMKTTFAGSVGFKKNSGYYGKHWEPQELWNTESNKVKNTNVSNIK